MEKSKKLKISIGLIYLTIVSLFLIYFFNKFEIEEVRSYEFIKSNRDYFYNLRESNLLIISIIFLFITVIWVLLLGFGSPIALISGFIFGKWIGTFVATFGLSIGALTLYLFGNYFFKDLIKEKFLDKFKNLEEKFKKREFTFFLIYRFVGGIPFQIANLLPVLFNVSAKNYLIGTFLGIIPQIFIMVSLGSGLEKIIDENEKMPTLSDMLFSQDIYYPILGFFVLFFTAIVVKKFFYK
tara:strand:+ start:1114 stop:1830 length:717 start_codon:yes stop_codon:yes gene_type:complete